jgi:thiosulfate/3-mercaptopyruvate sulfurtransferase
MIMYVKNRYKVLLALTLGVFAVVLSGFKKEQKDEPWRQEQLLDPSVLAKTLNSPKTPQPIIYSVGPGATIKSSIDIGPANDKENLDKLKQQLSTLPKDANIVIYCGCCPFKNCPNIRPAFDLLNRMEFINHKLLNISQNIKVDWIDKGFPVNK